MARAAAVKVLFTETKNEELNDILRHIQEKIILPAHLPARQRKIVMNPNKRAYLSQNPVVLEMQGMDHQFSTIDPSKDIENSKKILIKALKNMHTHEDWRNLATLLAGYRKAGIKLQPDHWGKIVRLAAKSHKIPFVLYCARHVSKTGFSLAGHEVAVRTCLGINRPLLNDWGRITDKLPRALREIEALLDLLHRPEHALDVKHTQNKLPFSRIIRGLILYARCAIIQRMEAGSADVDRLMAPLRDDVALLISLWEDVPDDLTQLREFAKLNPMVDIKAGRKTPRALNVTSYLQALAQNIRGMILARRIVGDAAEGLARAQEALEKHAREFLRTATDPDKGVPKAWVWHYERITTGSRAADALAGGEQGDGESV